MSEAEIPSLDGRMARCGCGATSPSNVDLPFFVYRGAGSREATEFCVCGYHRVAHDKPNDNVYLRMIRCGGKFTPRGDVGTDTYYCGHAGWD